MADDFGTARNLDVELLRWHLAAGVDAILDDIPHDRFNELLVNDGNVRTGEPVIGNKSPHVQREPIARLPAASIVATGSSEDWVLKALEAAHSAHSLAELRERLESFEGAALKRTARSMIMASAPTVSGVLIIGDIPEADDDRSGEVFSGRAGIMLDLMLACIGLSRETVALTTALPWRPPGNRAPTPQELAVLTPFLERQISLIAPRFILSFGTSTAQMLAGRQDQLLKLRGQWHELKCDDRVIPMLTTLGPSHLLRHPAQKRYAWRDLKFFHERISAN